MCGFSHTCVVFTKHFDRSQVFGRNHTCVVFTTHMEVHVISSKLDSNNVHIYVGVKGTDVNLQSGKDYVNIDHCLIVRPEKLCNIYHHHQSAICEYYYHYASSSEHMARISILQS